MSHRASQAGSSNERPSRASLQNGTLRRGQQTSSFQKALRDPGMGSMGLAFILMSGGVHMGWESLQALQLDFYPAAAPTMEDKALHRPLPSVHAAWIAFATILVKEWLYYETMRVARIRNSAALASNAIHHRMDSWTGIFALLAIVASVGIENSKWIDSLGGLVTSGMVLCTGLNSVMQSFTSFGKKAKKH
ncbi:hypothetical protein S40288_05219 [Stachybotrys chartarum IBT 40288]|nr:hypothetical protein S40288_05219 [Stachybotrys chartarum IBT 40288]